MTVLDRLREMEGRLRKGHVAFPDDPDFEPNANAIAFGISALALVRWCLMQTWHHSNDVDGGDLQEEALKLGLIVPSATPPEYEGEVQWYRLAFHGEEVDRG